MNNSITINKQFKIVQYASIFHHFFPQTLWLLNVSQDYLCSPCVYVKVNNCLSGFVSMKNASKCTC